MDYYIVFVYLYVKSDDLGPVRSHTDDVESLPRHCPDPLPINISIVAE